MVTRKRFSRPTAEIPTEPEFELREFRVAGLAPGDRFVLDGEEWFIHSTGPSTIQAKKVADPRQCRDMGFDDFVRVRVPIAG